MFENEKYFGNLDIMHKAVCLPTYTGICIGTYLIGKMGKGFIAILCDNGKHQKALAGYNPLTKKVRSLSLNEIKELISKFGSETIDDLHFNHKLDFGLLNNVIEDEKNHIEGRGIIKLNSIKVYYDTYLKEEIDILSSVFVGERYIQ